MAASGGGGKVLVVNNVPNVFGVPSIASFLESISGAYTTTRTHGGEALVLFWNRHLRRLADSARILSESRRDLFGSGRAPPWSAIEVSAAESLRVGLAAAKMGERGPAARGEELAITALVRGRDAGAFDLYLHIGCFVPPVFGSHGGARLAVAGQGRDVAAAKYSDWVRIRKRMEMLKPPMASELLLSNDNDQILEGSVTNFFVVVRRKVAKKDFDSSVDDLRLESERSDYFVEVQTASIADGVLNGVIRQLVIE